MTISYTRPLEHSWERMKAVLFRKPFPIESWFVMGFGAWLAELLSGSNGSYGSQWHDSGPNAGALLGEVGDFLSKPMMLALVLAGALVLSVVLLVLSWISARAQFVFLENVVHGRAAFSEPWKRSGKLGRSLFLWQAVMSFSWLVPLTCIVVPLVPAIVNALAGQGWHLADLGAVIAGGALAAVSALLIACVLSLNENFVVPLMWRHDEGAMAAWARFRPLLSSHFGDFAAWLGFSFLLALVTGIGVVLAGLLTCCVGLVLMIIPYIGTVTLLPVHFIFRAYGPMFLRQYGPEWDVWSGMTQAAGAARVETQGEVSPIE